ncbi:MAG: sugar phosphate isomerase/epimerase [Rhodospirillales bacterium]|nr:sugar phosphate isomerase/epimerase [Rhodospirillales bacterium]
MKGFGIHSSLWTMAWDRETAEYSVNEAKKHGLDIVEIALLDPPSVDGGHSRGLFEKAGITPVCSLGLPDEIRASVHPEKALEFLTTAIEKAAEIGAPALSGVIYGSIGERTGEPPTQKELDNITWTLERAAKVAKPLNVELGIEAINRYETHLVNTAEQAVSLLERVGMPNVFVHLDTYHMNIEEKGIANGILRARDHLKYIHLSESDRGVPGLGTVAWDEVFTALAAIGYEGGMAMESFINLPPEVGSGLSVWRPVTEEEQDVLGFGLPFLKKKAQQFGLI